MQLVINWRLLVSCKLSRQLDMIVHIRDIASDLVAAVVGKGDGLSLLLLLLLLLVVDLRVIMLRILMRVNLHLLNLLWILIPLVF